MKAMKYLHTKTVVLLIMGSLFINNTTAQELTIVEQDYNRALKIAGTEQKLLFIDFYTTWCKPCKELDKFVFSNKKVQKEMGNEFVLLRYDAENDSVFHLSKKHHVSSYPSGLILNKDGYVLHRQYGFKGDDAETLQNSVREFTVKAMGLNNENRILKGYSNVIDIADYPQFYQNYVERTDTKFSVKDKLNLYLAQDPDIFSEEFFATIIYFASDATPEIADIFLDHKDKYTDLYGDIDVRFALTFMSYGKFKEAADSKNLELFKKAKQYALKALGKEPALQISEGFEDKFNKI